MAKATSFVLFMALLAVATLSVNAKKSGTCKVSKKGIDVTGSTNELTLYAKGKRIFWCNNSKFELNGKGKLHGDTKATLVSADGVWKGRHFYSHANGMPHFEITNKNTGEKIVVIAEQRPDARQKAPNGSNLSLFRRKVVSSTGANYSYVLRTETTSGKLPKSCKGDQDAYVPLTATFKLVAC